MRISEFTLVSFLFALLLFIPLFYPNENIILLPNEELNFQINISSPKINIFPSENNLITMNISYVNMQDGKEIVLESKLQFKGATTIKLENTGVYKFALFSLDYTEISIEFEGIHTLNIILAILGMFIHIAGVFYEKKKVAL